MERKKFSALLVATCAMLVFVAHLIILCAKLTAAEMDVVSFRGTWSATIKVAPWHLGRDKGFFAEEGIDLRLPEGQGSAINAQLVGVNTLKIAACEYGSMMKAVQEGMPIKGFFAYFQISPMAIISPAAAPIRRPKELEGKSVGTSPGSSLSAVFPALAKITGTDQSKIKFVMVSPAAVPSLLLEKKVDAILNNWPTYVSLLERKGLKAHYIPYANFGVNVINEGAIVNANFMKEKPDLLKRFVRAAQKSWAYAQKHPEEAVNAFAKEYPHYEIEGQVEVLRSYLALLYSPATQEKPIGWMAKEDWERSQEILVEGALLNKKLPVDNYYTNEFVSR